MESILVRSWPIYYVESVERVPFVFIFPLLYIRSVDDLFVCYIIIFRMLRKHLYGKIFSCW